MTIAELTAKSERSRPALPTAARPSCGACMDNIKQETGVSPIDQDTVEPPMAILQ